MELAIDQALKKGIEAHKAGNLQEADRYYTAILTANPKHSDANHNMGVLAVGIGKTQEALPFFKTALETNSSVPQYWLSYIDALIKLNRIEDAKTTFEHAKTNGAKGAGFDKIAAHLDARTEPFLEDQNSLKMQSNILDELKLEQAIKLAKKRAKEGLRSETRRIYHDILERFPKNKKALEGLRTFSNAFEQKGSIVRDPPRNKLQSVFALYKQGQFEKAIDKASQILIEFPKSVRLLEFIGAANQGLGKQNEAIEFYEKALLLKPDSADAYNNMGAALQDLGKPEQALEAYKKALSLRPNFAEAYNNMGISLVENGKPKEAIKAHIKAFSLKPDYAEASSNLGDALQAEGKLVEAMKAYSKALSLKPSYITYNNLGNALQKQHKLVEAVDAYQKALVLKADYADAHYNLGNALKQQGKLKEAKLSFQKAISFKPDYGRAKHMLSSLIGDTPETAPREYVENLFDSYADKFETSLVKDLKYNIPKLISDILTNSNNNKSLGTVLDLGCGTGLLGLEIKKQCSRLEGIDISKKMLTQANRKNVYDKLSQFDILDYLSRMPLSFDYYIALDVFIYVGDLREIFRLIKSRNNKVGKLVFSTEYTELDGYHLLKTGRYSHSNNYIESLCKEFDYKISHFSTADLRIEKGHFLTGGIYILNF